MSLWKRWVSLLDRRESGLSLALVRIACGTVITLHLLRNFYKGVVDWVWVDNSYGGLRVLSPGWMEWFGGLTPQNVHILVLLTAFSSALMALGLLTRVSTLGVWLGFGYLADLNGHAGGSYDELLKNIVFLLLLSDCSAELSLDQKIRPRPREVTAWPRYLMVTQLVVVYWMTAIQKVSSSWVPFGDSDALWYILQQPTWGRHDLPITEMLPLYPLARISTFLVWAWEQSAPLLLLSFYFRDTRDQPGRLRSFFNRYDFRFWYLLFGVAMHAGIEALMEVGPFSFSTTTLYFACVHPDEWRALWARLAAKIR
jgi:hypothetical protein